MNSDNTSRSNESCQLQRPVSQFPKQAVVVIHGIGEQIPMDTIRGFVRTVWQTDPDSLNPNEEGPSDVWSRPDLRTGSLELRRITTRQSSVTVSFPQGVRTDFYEMYWADLSAGSSWESVKSWLGGLLFRNPFTRVPRRVFAAWVLLWAACLMVGFLVFVAFLPKGATLGPIDLWALPAFAQLGAAQNWLLVFAATALAYATSRLVMPYVGRVVRYTRASPDNIAAREAIRARGLTLLRQLHGGEYERIIVVGHSLGSILAYDLVSYLWSERQTARVVQEETPEFEALRELETTIEIADREGPSRWAIERFHQKQAALAGTLRRREMVEDRWLITDFVTLGSPLAHAEFLLARTKADLNTRKVDREFPTCPPYREILSQPDLAKAAAAGFFFRTQSARLASFPFGKGRWQMHHAAPFAAVRWTNIHDPSWLVLLGDIVSGPLRRVFGFGVTDVDLRQERGRVWSFTHTKYWLLRGNDIEHPPAHVLALRRALDIAGRSKI